MAWHDAFLARVQAFALPTWEELPDLGLYMDQVITYIERVYRPLFGEGRRMLTSSMINNYVKAALIDRPVKKKYGRAQLAQLVMLCGIKQAVTLEDMRGLIRAQGEEDDEARYRAFCAQTGGTAARFSGLLTSLDPLQCAIEAAAYQLLCEEMLCVQDKQKP